jgi:Rrf2 family protein
MIYGRRAMTITSRGRYALASMILLAQNAPEGTRMTVAHMAGRLGVSRMYLEQVITLLRKGGLVTSVKGAQGGRRLALPADEISAADILSVTETSIFDDAESTAADAEPGIDRALRDRLFDPANAAFREIFERMPLSDLAEDALRKPADESYMYCI